MSGLRHFWLRLLNVFRRDGAERQLAKEIDAHLRLLQDDFERRGMPPAEARAAARRAFGGGVEQAKEHQRDARSFAWLEDLRRDIGYGVRTLARTPGFTAVAVITLALGIGASTVIYSVVRNVVLDPFPYAHSDRMVDIVVKDASDRIIRGPYFSAPEFLDYQEQSHVFEDVVGTSVDVMHWSHDGGADRVVIAWMTPNGFTFLGVPPMLGRVFGTADAAAGAPPVAVLNNRSWIKFFGADPSAVGRTVVLDGEARTIVGIMPPRFEWNIADFWLPAALSRSDDPALSRTSRAFQARIKPGIDLKQAEADLNIIAARRAKEHPADYPPHSRIEVITVIDWVVREFRGVLYTLFGAVSLLLLIACCNVANMLLARATTREREISIRAAIGATRGRIVRQLLVESALLASGGLVVGCLLAYGGIAALADYMPRQGVPWETQIRLDRPVLLFALVAAAIATISFGLFPAVQSARRDLVAGTNVAGRGSAGRRQTRMRSGLVVAQVALSIVLLLGAGLLMRTFVKLTNVDLGFDSRNLLVAGLWFPADRQDPGVDQLAFYRQVLDRVGAMPGVRSVALSNGRPPFAGMGTEVKISGLAIPDQSSALVVLSSERLIDTVGLALTRGRQLTGLDIEQSHHVAQVNEAFVRKYFGSTDPIGRIVQLERLKRLPVPVADPTFEIVGVVRDTLNQGPRELPAPQVFVPFSVGLPWGLTLTVRTTGDPLRIVDTVRREVQGLDHQVAMVDPTTLDDLIQRVFFARPRFSLLVLGIFACTGILLVACGVYGVLAYTVSQQSREIAIRMALGGARSDVIQMVLRLGFRSIGLGLAIGVAAGLATNTLLVSQLWNISPHDPVTLTAGVSIVLIVGMVACWVPARRAVRVEPIVALRHE
jgi:putative ABC transport system permease protein